MLVSFFLLAASIILQPSHVSITNLESQGYKALRANDIAGVVEIAKKLDTGHAKNFQAAMARGSLLLRAGRPKLALPAFDEAARLRPREVPYMWQRGIAQFYAGEYAAGREQFVVHRDVNANDVENAVWHFLCVAKIDGFDAARKNYLPAPGDPRIPMQQVYDLFAGIATTQDVIDAFSKLPADSPRAASAGFYGELYLGLYEEARGNANESKQWLRKAVARGKTHYMADVARVHLEQLTK